MSLKTSMKVSLKNLGNPYILVASNRYDGDTIERGALHYIVFYGDKQ